MAIQRKLSFLPLKLPTLHFFLRPSLPPLLCSRWLASLSKTYRTYSILSEAKMEQAYAKQNLFSTLNFLALGTLQKQPCTHHQEIFTEQLCIHLIPGFFPLPVPPTLTPPPHSLSAGSRVPSIISSGCQQVYSIKLHQILLI